MKGETVALSFTAWPAVVPVTIGASFTAVAITVVVLLVVGASTPLLAEMVKVVVSSSPVSTRLSAGSNARRESAVVAWAAVPVKVYTPLPALTNPLDARLADVNTPLSASSSVTLMSSVPPTSDAITTPSNGRTVSFSLTVWPAVAPAMVGAESA